MYIVALREILPEVPTTAFFASEGRARDEQTDRHEAGDTAQLAIAGRYDTRAYDRCVPRRELLDERRQPALRSDQPGVTPHEVTHIRG